MTPLLPEKLPDSVDNAISNATEKPTKEVGEIFNDLLYLVFGGIHFNAEKKRIRYKYALERFEKSCQEKINAIPLENKSEPNTQTICQALEDSKYCVEDEDIRELFANLISSTMDDRVSEFVHPSFSPILKQMTSKDAKFLLAVRNQEVLPVCNIKVSFKNSGRFNILYNNFYAQKTHQTETETAENSFIISTLSRLGLIEVSYGSQIADDSVYDIFKESLFYKSKVEWEEESGDRSVSLQKGWINLTHTGKQFLKACSPIFPDMGSDYISDNDSKTKESSSEKKSNESDSRTPVVARKIGVRGNDGRAAFFNSCSGEIYLYKKFLDDNYIGKTLNYNSETTKLIGWEIAIIANKPLHIAIYQRPDNKYRCVVPYFKEKGIDYTNQISAYLIEGGILKIEFDFESTPLDIYDLDKILVVSIYG